mmetsp:Transcript_46429/g.87171  ORF Transcript_46429/g.87171 Transcript_46429/m.87171 type:complete len:206 (+) Transcript_46429:2616-3233(+)
MVLCGQGDTLLCRSDLFDVVEVDVVVLVGDVNVRAESCGSCPCAGHSLDERLKVTLIAGVLRDVSITAEMASRCSRHLRRIFVNDLAPDCTWLVQLQRHLDGVFSQGLARHEDDRWRRCIIYPNIRCLSALWCSDGGSNMGVHIILHHVIRPRLELSVDRAVLGPTIDIILGGFIQVSGVSGLQLVDSDVPRVTWSRNHCPIVCS